MATDSEFRVYEYIRAALETLGWNKKNPARGGDVYTQGEFRSHDPLLHDALHQDTPENIVCIPWNDGLRYWIVEAKRAHNQINKAVSEAKRYAQKINEHKTEGGGSIHHGHCRQSR